MVSLSEVFANSLNRKFGLLAALGVLPSCFYWVLVVKPALKRRKELVSLGAARAMLSQSELRKVQLEALKSTNTLSVIGSLTLSSLVKFEDLRSMLTKGKVSAVEVHNLFRSRAAASHSMTRCLIGYIPEAAESAKDCDQAVTDRKPLGILHGIPVSIKESLEVKGHASTIGLASRCDQFADRDSAVVQAVKQAGGVPFCRTNIPQTNLSYGCSNPIFGSTVNPYNLLRTPGGSSGGEAALVATGGSVIGIGSDIGGSVRVPAAFCGVCGFKPTAGRISGRGVASVVKGQTGVAGSVGVLAREAVAIAATMDAVSAAPSLADPLQPPVQWNQFGDLTSSRKLRIGFYVADGFLPAIPANARVVKEACALLRAKGHEVVPFQPIDVINGIHLFLGLLTADGATKALQTLKDETADPSCKAFLDGVKLKGSPGASRALLRRLRKEGKIRAANLFEKHGKVSVTRYWELQAEKDELRRKWCTGMADAGIDLVLCPSHTMVAPIPDVVATSGMTLCYTQLFNLLDFPACTVPMGVATEADEAAMAGWPMSVLEEQFGSGLPEMIRDGRVYGQQKDHLEDVVMSTCKEMAGLPLSVQFVGKPYADEVVLRCAKELQNSAPAMPPPPPAANSLQQM